MDSNTALQTGTSTVGIVFDKGIVLCADKRATMGTYIANKEAEKIHLVSDRIGMTIAGGVGDAQALVRLLRAELELLKYNKGDRVTVNSAATLIANILQGNKYYPYFVQLIIGGFDTKPQLYDLDMLGGLGALKYTATGSGSPLAIAILDSEYKENNSKDEAVRLAVKAVNAAIKRDAACGDGIDVLIITSDSTKKLAKNEVAQLMPA
ncbi:MAG TPA: archaeal proteasome endopeptidase complex subunit beta [Candidatus Norongarragalinales archaeon]|jgi:proteasome beta subunit|nr:archaeal proteasome endopeptidase complex subunit beta [Candidatus Norongarragalinales archaeon]